MDDRRTPPSLPAPEGAGPPVIEARNLTKRFGNLSALEDLELVVQRGEAVAVFGPNGAGKTTLVRILALALRPTSGTLRLAGHDPRGRERQIKCRSGVLSHRAHLYDELTGRENLEFFGRLYGVREPEARAGALLATFGLEDRADDPVGTYSRGMQQRASVARCLIHDPELLYLDEPFSGLDPHAALVLRDTLQQLRERRRTLLLVTHQLALGLELSDRWLLLHRGRIVEQGASAGVDPEAFVRTYRERLAPRGVPA